MCLAQLKLIRTLRLWVFFITCSIAIYILKDNGKFSLTHFQQHRSTEQFLDDQQKTFYKYWTLQRQRRFNYTAIMLPCQHDMEWRPYYPDRNASVITSAKTSRAHLEVKPAGQFTRLIIQSYNLLNTTKYIGGDTWRIFLRGKFSVPVTMIDHRNGTYEAFFLITIPGRYYVELYLEYTLCDGYKDPPPEWFLRGLYFSSFDVQSGVDLDTTMRRRAYSFLKESNIFT